MLQRVPRLFDLIWAERTKGRPWFHLFAHAVSLVSRQDEKPMSRRFLMDLVVDYASKETSEDYMVELDTC